MTEEEKKNKRWHLHLTHNRKNFTNDAYINDPLARMKAMRYYYVDYCPITVEDRWTGKTFILEEWNDYEKKVSQFMKECEAALRSKGLEKKVYEEMYNRVLYQIIFVDEFDNFTNLGFYKSLNDSLDDINGSLASYGKQYKLEKGEVLVYPSTLGKCFDLDLINHFAEKFGEEKEEQVMEDLHGVSIRGFIYELTEEEFNAMCKIFNL